MNIIRIILAVIVVLLSGYSLITGEFGFMPYTLFLLGGMLFVMGMIENREKRKGNALISFLSAVFAIIVSVYILVG